MILFAVGFLLLFKIQKLINHRFVLIDVQYFFGLKNLRGSSS
jgi:hypothetical protein